MDEGAAHVAARFGDVKRRTVRGRTPWRRIYSCIEPSSLLYGDTKDSRGWDARFDNIRRYDVAENYAVSDQNNSDRHRVRMSSTRHIRLRNEWSDIKTLQNRDVSVNFSNPQRILDLESAMIVDGDACSTSSKAHDMKAARRRRHTVTEIEYASSCLQVSEANKKATKRADVPAVVTNHNDGFNCGNSKHEEILQNEHFGTQDVNADYESTIACSSDRHSLSASSEEHSYATSGSHSKACHQSAQPDDQYFPAVNVVKTYREDKMEGVELADAKKDPETSTATENRRREGDDNFLPNTMDEDQGGAHNVQIIASAISPLQIKEDTICSSPNSNSSADRAQDGCNESCDETSDTLNPYFDTKAFSRRVSEPIIRFSNCQRRTRGNLRDSAKKMLGQSSVSNPTGIEGTLVEQDRYKCLYQLAVTTMKKTSKNLPKIVDFIALLQSKGIWPSDPRLKQTCLLFAKEKDGQDTEFTEEVFTRVCSPAIQLIRNALLSHMTIPGFALFSNRMSQVFEALRSSLVHMERKGIGHDDPSFDPTSNYLDFMRSRRSTKDRSLSMSVCTVDGQRLSFGDSDNLHPLDICASVLNYCIACRRIGIEIAKSYMGRTPPSTSQDEFSFDLNGKVLNPFTKAGAIMTSALLSQNESIEPSISELHEIYSKAMGDESICCDNLSYNLKRLYAHEQISLAYYLSARQKLPKMYSMAPGDILELNFRSSSTATTSDACSVAAATLAAGGTCPLTGEAVFKEDVVQHVLKRISDINLPCHAKNAKEDDAIPFVWSESGVMFLVVPGVLGLVCFVQSQPRRLVRELADCLMQNLKSTFNFSVYRNLRKRAHSPQELKK